MNGSSKNGFQNSQAKDSLQDDNSKWWKLGFLCIFLAIAAGLSPAAASYVDFFSRSGVQAKKYCKQGEFQCEMQQSFLGHGVINAQMAARIIEPPGAVIYQRFGATVMLKLAAYFHLAGWLLVLVLTQYNIEDDALWAQGMQIIDMSRGFIKYVPYAFLDQFPGQAATVLAWGNAGHNCAALVALALIFMVDLCWLGLRALALIQISLGLIFIVFAPMVVPKPRDDKPEEVEEEQENRKKPDQDDVEILAWVSRNVKDQKQDKQKEERGECDEVCAAFTETCYFLWPDKFRHIFVLAVLGIGPCWSAQYQAIAVAWGTLLFPTEASVKILSSNITISSFIANCACSPLAALFLERFGLAAFLFCVSCLQFSCLPLTATATIMCQTYIGFISVLLFAIEPVLLGLHLFAYVDVRWGGMAAFIWNCGFFYFYYKGMMHETEMFWYAAVAEDKYRAYHKALRKVINVGCLAYMSYAIMAFFFPTPNKPVLPPEKQAELCEPYLCRNFDQVAKVLNYPLDLAEQAVLQQVHDKQSRAIMIHRAQTSALRERLEHFSYGSISKILTSGKLFWKPQHVAIKPRTGVLMAGIAMPADKLETALRSQANVDSFGHGYFKSLGHLKTELSRRRSSFMVDENNPDRLLRVTTVVVLRITALFEGQIYFLIEVGSVYADDSKKQDFRFPATKKGAEQTVEAATSKILDELGMGDVAVEIDNENVESTVESQESVSYPGLLTRYVKKLLGVRIVTTSDDPFLQDIGLTPRPRPWARKPQYDPETSYVVNRKTAELYEWIREDEIHNRHPDFLIHYPTKVQGKKTPADVGLDLSTVLRDRAQVVAMLRYARKNDRRELSNMFSKTESARYIQGMPYWMKEDDDMKYYRDKILKALKLMICREEQPDSNVLVESLLLDLMVERQAATTYLQAQGML